jgi:adenylate cyclase
VLELQRLLVRFKQSLKAEDRLTEDQLAGLQMRAGVASGKMYVGNAGPSFASDFTVLGDRVNLASRLESANKVTGTGNLVTARTLSYEGTEEFLARPVAKLVVAGRKESALVYEVLCRKSEADERTRLLVSLSTAVFEAYQAGDLVGCRASAQRMRAELGVDPASERFTDFYLQRCDGNGRLPGEPWDGHIELAHK